MVTALATIPSTALLCRRSPLRIVAALQAVAATITHATKLVAWFKLAILLGPAF